MFKKKIYIVTISIFLLISSATNALVFDNRYIPLFQRPRKLIGGCMSQLSCDLLFATASSAFDANEETIGIPEIFGTFDEGQLGEAFTAVGLTNPLRSEWQGTKIPWKVNGKLQVQGAQFSYYQKLFGPLTIGCSWIFLRVNTRNIYTLLTQELNFTLGPSDVVELDDTRRTMFEDLGISNNHTSQIGFGDIDTYLRVGGHWDYTLKCRMIDVGLRGGVLIPTGQSALITSASSIPFGGNGHWGFYVAVDGLFEVKEDMQVGLYARLSKRLAKTCVRRMPAVGEPRIFGAVQDLAWVNPGVTFVFSPFFVLENLRGGLGIGVQYTLTAHQEDEWDDVRGDSKTIPVQLGQVENTSSWHTSYVTLNVFYDFGKVKPERKFAPVIEFYWDVPAMLFTPKRTPKTHKVTLGVSFPF